MNTRSGHAIYFRTSNTGCLALHGSSWTDADLLTRAGKPGLDNSVFHRARTEMLERLNGRFPNYRPPSDRDSFGAAARKATT